MTEYDNKTTNIFTIGCSGKDARQFFTILAAAGVKKIIDVRLYNTSQLAGFTKRPDLEYFLRQVNGTDYVHLPIMAPTKQLLNDYKKGLINWPQYESQFNSIMTHRRIEARISLEDINMACFLCSEAKPDLCHRRLVAEYLAKQWPQITIQHL